MPRNIFGLVSEGLTNPLTEDLDVAGFELQDVNKFWDNVNKIFTNEIHDNGEGNIAVHEPFNMTNNQITNVAEPTQNKDAATKQYVDNAIVTPVIEYDIMAAYSDETTALSAGLLDVNFPVPRDFLLLFIEGFINQSATSNNFQFEVFRNGSSVGTSNFVSGAVDSDAIVFVGGLSVSQNDRFTVSIPVADATATGLKIAFLGQQN